MRLRDREPFVPSRIALPMISMVVLLKFAVKEERLHRAGVEGFVRSQRRS